MGGICCCRRSSEGPFHGLAEGQPNISMRDRVSETRSLFSLWREYLPLGNTISVLLHLIEKNGILKNDRQPACNHTNACRIEVQSARIPLCRYLDAGPLITFGWRMDAMFIQPKYDRIEGTPLSFLKFVRVTLVLGFVMNLVTLIPLLTSEADWYSIIYHLLGLTLRILAFLWLGDMKWRGVLAYCGSFLLIMLDGIAAMALSAYYGAFESIGTAIGRVLAATIILAPVWVYFGKRRLLFDPAPGAKKTQEPAQPAPCAPQKSIDESLHEERKESKDFESALAEDRQIDVTPAKFCRNCGCELVPGSKFCSFCGTKVVEAW